VFFVVVDISYHSKQDLDAALISRFDLCIRYELPDEHTRCAVFAR
jgi:AAA+ superfamily predicted ATPase